MKLSQRLQSCADLVQRGNVALDVGTDHGYLAIYLLQNHICPRVYASDLREGPLSAARRSAIRLGVEENLTLCLSDGLHNLNLSEIQTVICAGMGGDTIQHILEEGPEVRSPGIQLVLQPQSKAGDLRRYLAENGFEILHEKLSRDGKFLYTAMEARFSGVVRTLSPWEALVSEALLRSGDPLLKEYLQRLRNGVEQSISGLHKAKTPNPELLAYYETALRALTEMEEAR